MEYTREKLIEICERAVVPSERWLNRDTHSAQTGVGLAWALLKANCPFRVRTEGQCKTDERTIWLDITAEGFAKFEYGGSDEEHLIYLPTEKRLEEAAGGDWY